VVEDAALVEAARRDPAAFLALYDRYLHPVHRYCMLRLDSREAAEDATSEVFVKALANLGGYRGDGAAFPAWLFRIARNVVVDAQRQRGRGGASLAPELADALVDPDPAPEDIALARGERDAVRAALRTLPADQRETLELQLAGLATEEIATILGRSPNAVRILRHRAQRALRPALAALAPEPAPPQNRDRPC
jgi:RNA polymerase sigma-70 factor (ECF subfamily)